ncbi:hypothetical protein CASFOL_010384 [Castilleja foliolosa]|uniref:SHSP domain-containing protein n=1 Tax=Castilleja foliolosa TaxID=1961234 RepID=A0ABD3DWH4_9LAMI
MASSLKYLSGLLRSSSHRRAATSRCFSTEAVQKFYETFNVEREPSPTAEAPELPPFIHHEFKVQGQEDGFHIRLYMAGVRKENVKVWVQHDELIAEGRREKEFEDEDDTDGLIKYRMTCPPAEAYDLDAIKADMKNGILQVVVPRRA